MGKIKKWKTIIYDTMDNHPTWKDIKDIEFQDDDRILITYDDSDYTEDKYIIEVEREVEETDEEYQKRIDNIKMTEHILKKSRYQQYLELSKEFGDGTKIETLLYNRDLRHDEGL